MVAIEPHQITGVALRLYESHGADFARALRESLGRLLFLSGDNDPTLLPLTLLESQQARYETLDEPWAAWQDEDEDDWELIEEQDAYDASLIEADGTRRQGEKWQGPSGRWFTLNDKNRVVPTSAPGAEPKRKRKPAQSNQDAPGGDQAAQTPDSQPAPRKPSERAAKKAERPSVESLKGKLAAVMSGGDAAGLADELMKLTKDQIRSVRDKLGSKIGKSKKDLVDNLVAEAVRKARGQAETKPQAPQSASNTKPMSSADLMGEIAKAGDSTASLAELRSQSGLSKKEFDQAIFQLADAGKVFLIPDNRSGQLGADELETLVRDPVNTSRYYTAVGPRDSDEEESSQSVSSTRQMSADDVLGEIAGAGESTVSLAELRGRSGLSKADFDRTIFQLADAGKIFLIPDDRSVRLNADERESLVRDPKSGMYYSEAGPREVEDEQPATSQPRRERVKPPINFDDVDLGAEDDDEAGTSLRRGSLKKDEASEKAERIKQYQQQAARGERLFED